MRILGIDPGLRITGFGVVDVDGSRLTYVASGVVRTPDADLPARLAVIFDGVRALVAQHRPTCAAIEKVFGNVNPQSTLLLGQARGAAICGLMTAGIDVAEYTALQTKQATVGHGRATKAQVQQMVTRLLRLSGAPTTDAADALACAICHAHVGASVAVLRVAAPDLAIAGLRIRRGRVAARG
jgi:crossover junction endodeoxyribonuclease RuvC